MKKRGHSSLEVRERKPSPSHTTLGRLPARLLEHQPMGQLSADRADFSSALQSLTGGVQPAIMRECLGSSELHDVLAAD